MTETELEARLRNQLPTVADHLLDADGEDGAAAGRDDPETSRGDASSQRPWWPAVAAAATIVIGLVGVLVARDTGNGEPQLSTGEAPSLGVAPPPRVLLLGDSVTYGIGVALEDLEDPPVQVYNLAQLYCQVLVAPRRSITGNTVDASGDCAGWRKDWTSAAGFFDPQLVVLGIGPWEVFDLVVENRVLPFGSAEHDTMLRARLDEIVGAMAGPDHPLVLLTTPPLQRDAAMQPPGGEPEWTGAEAWRTEHLNALLREIADRHDDVLVVDLAEWVCPQGDCRRGPGGSELRSDGVHYSVEGARIVAEWLASQFAALASG